MSTSHNLYLDTHASRHALRDALAQGGIGLDNAPDWKHLSGVFSASTNVTIHDDLSWQGMRWDNGVVPTRLISFGFRKENWQDFYTQTICGIVALLKAFSNANGYWIGWDAEVPMLLRLDGHLILSQQEFAGRGFWDPARQPSYVAMVDLPYTVAPLGPWDIVELPMLKQQSQSVTG